MNTSHLNVRHVTIHLLHVIFCNRSFRIIQFFKCSLGAMDHNPFQCKACQTHLHQVTFARVLELSHGYKCSFRIVNTGHRNVRHVTKHLLQLIFCNRSFKIVHYLKTFKCSFVEWSQIHFNVTHITTHLHQVTFALCSPVA